MKMVHTIALQFLRAVVEYVDGDANYKHKKVLDKQLSIHKHLKYKNYIGFLICAASYLAKLSEVSAPIWFVFL